MEVANEGSNAVEVVGVEVSRGCRGSWIDRVDGFVLGSEREAPQLGAGGVSPSFK